MYMLGSCLHELSAADADRGAERCILSATQGQTTRRRKGEGTESSRGERPGSVEGRQRYGYLGRTRPEVWGPASTYVSTSFPFAHREAPREKRMDRGGRRVATARRASWLHILEGKKAGDATGKQRSRPDRQGTSGRASHGRDTVFLACAGADDDGFSPLCPCPDAPNGLARARARVAAAPRGVTRRRRLPQHIKYLPRLAPVSRPTAGGNGWQGASPRRHARPQAGSSSRRELEPKGTQTTGCQGCRGWTITPTRGAAPSEGGAAS